MIGMDFRRRVRALALTCPICRDGAETYTRYGCPACGGTGRVDPTPREDLEAAAEMFRREAVLGTVNDTEKG